MHFNTLKLCQIIKTREQWQIENGGDSIHTGYTQTRATSSKIFFHITPQTWFCTVARQQFFLHSMAFLLFLDLLVRLLCSMFLSVTWLKFVLLSWSPQYPGHMYMSLALIYMSLWLDQSISRSIVHQYSDCFLGSGLRM